jgi:hypothetical protein
MPSKKLPPEQSAVNLDIEQMENDIFTDEKRLEKRRGKAFQYLCLSILCDLNINEIDDEDIVDGGDEEGIDMINLDRLTDDKIVVSIFNCKSSERSNYSANDLTKLGRELEYVFEERDRVYTKLGNRKLVKKIADIRDNKEGVVGVNVYYCVFKGEKLPENVKRKESEIKSRYIKFLKSQYPNAKFNLIIVNSKYLFDKKIERNESLRNITIKIPYYDKDKKMRPEVQTGEIIGYLMTVKWSGPLSLHAFLVT